MSSEHEPLDSAPVDASDAGFEPLLEYLARTRGFDFTAYKRPTLTRRVQRRIEAVGVSGFLSYIDYLETQIELVHKVGEPNYLQTQMGK